MSTTSPRTNSEPKGDPAELRRLIDELSASATDPVFTHTSWAPDRASSYERLEFLGDSVLELAVARALFDRFPDYSEGRLAKLRSHVVSRTSCSVVARELGLGERLVTLAPGDIAGNELAKLARNRNILAALLEAALAALFLEHGFERIEGAVIAAFAGRIEYASTTWVDHKTELQEALAREGRQVAYDVLEVEGPPHDRRFTSAAIVDGEQAGVGTGRTKKAAEQEAARLALDRLGGLGVAPIGAASVDV